MDALFLMAPMVTAMGYEGIGDFMMDGEGRLSRVPAGRVSPFAFPGVQIVHPRLFDNAPSGGFSTNVVWDRAIEKERLFGVRLDGVWDHARHPASGRRSRSLSGRPCPRRVIRRSAAARGLHDPGKRTILRGVGARLVAALR